MTAVPALAGYGQMARQFSHNARAYLAYYFLLSVHLGIYGVLFNLYVLRLGIREEVLGLMVSLVFVATGLAAVPAAALCDRLGRKATLLLSVAVAAPALLLLYTVTAPGWLLAISVLYGIGIAFYTVAGSPFLMENSGPGERMYLFSANSALSQVAYIVGCVAGGLLPNALASIGIDPLGPEACRYALFLSLAVVVLSAIPLSSMREPARRRDPIRRFSALGSALRSPNVQKLIVINGLVGIGAGMIVPFFNVYFHDRISATAGQIGLVYAIGELVMAAGLMAIPLLVARIGKIRTIVFTELASIPFLLALALATNIYVAAFAYVLRMTLMNMANPAINAFNMELVSDEERATVSSLTSTAWYLCQAVSAGLSGLMIAGSDYWRPFLVTCVAYLCSSSLYYLYFGRGGTEPARPMAVR